MNNIHTRVANTVIIREKRGQQRFAALYETLRERISQLRYPPGTQLTEKALSIEFEVSRTPIRRALQALEADRLVETRVGVGTFVTSVKFSTLPDAYSLRMHLSELIGSFPPDGPREPRIVSLEALKARAEILVRERDFDEFTRVNNAMMRELGQCTGNSALRLMSERLFYETARSYYQLVRDGAADWKEETDAMTEEIRDLLKCVRLADWRAVGLTRRNYISFNLARVIKPKLGASMNSNDI